MSETRWVERVTALESFVSNYVAIVRALMAIREMLKRRQRLLHW